MNRNRALVLASVAGIIAISPSLLAQVVDHTHIGQVASYPQSTMDAIGQQRWFFTHASVGGNMVAGLEDLHAADPTRYQLDPLPVSYLSGEQRADDPPDPTAPGTVYECQRGNPGWSAKLQIFDNSVRTSGWHLPAVDAAMDKFCYIDEHADAATYLATMEALEADFPGTRFVYITMPLTTAEDSGNILRSPVKNSPKVFSADGLWCRIRRAETDRWGCFSCLVSRSGTTRARCSTTSTSRS